MIESILLSIIVVTIVITIFALAIPPVIAFLFTIGRALDRFFEWTVKKYEDYVRFWKTRY